jgi:hypothetical protein
VIDLKPEAAQLVDRLVRDATAERREICIELVTLTLERVFALGKIDGIQETGAAAQSLITRLAAGSRLN